MFTEIDQWSHISALQPWQAVPLKNDPLAGESMRRLLMWLLADSGASDVEQTRGIYTVQCSSAGFYRQPSI